MAARRRITAAFLTLGLAAGSAAAAPSLAAPADPAPTPYELVVDTATHTPGYPQADAAAWQTLSSAKVSARTDALHTLHALFVLAAAPPKGESLRVQFGVGVRQGDGCVATQTLDRVVKLTGAQSFDVGGKRTADTFDPSWNCLFARTLATGGGVRYDEVTGVGTASTGVAYVYVSRVHKRVDLPRRRWVRIPVYVYSFNAVNPMAQGIVITASGPGVRSRPTRMPLGVTPDDRATAVWGFARVRLSGKGPRQIQVTATPSNGPSKSTDLRARTHRSTTLRPGRYASRHPQRLSFRVTRSGRVQDLRERLWFDLGGSGGPWSELIRFPSFRLDPTGWTVDQTHTSYGLQQVAIVNARTSTKAIVTGMLDVPYDLGVRRLVAHRVGR